MDWKKIFPKWELTDEHCPECHQLTKKQRGMTRQNMKTLFTFRMSGKDWLVFLILIMVGFAAYAYNHDIQVCKEFVSRIEVNGCAFCSKYLQNTSVDWRKEVNDTFDRLKIVNNLSEGDLG